MTRISVIVPTVGRDTLQAALDSCAQADEVIVVENRDGDHGYAARMRGMAQATGTHLAFLDDDDVYTDGAVELMRAHAADVPVIFRMDDPLHGVIWRDRELRLANVGTPMFVVPNRPGALGVWEPFEHGRCGDFAFISQTVELQGGPVWRPEVVCTVRPHERRPSVAVVTPWRNRLEYLPGFQHAMDVGRPDEVIVVDNGSDPAVPLPGLRFEENLGFSAACNAGLDAASSDAVLFLNNDVRATRAGWIGVVRAALEPGVLVGAQLRNDPHAAVDGVRLPYLDGWCLAGMKADLVEIGGWDESYSEPSYFGDNDLCLRARAAGMELREVRTGLKHLGNGTLPPDDLTVQWATQENRARFEALARELLLAA